MKKYLPILALTLLAFQAQAQLNFQSPIYNTTGTTSNQINSLTKDAAGNIYFCGKQSDGITMGSIALNSTAGGAYFGKITPGGTLVWMKQGGCANSSGDNANDIAVDRNSNVYVCGSLSGFATGSFDGTSLGSSYLGFVAKFNSSGTLIWVSGYGSNVYSIAVDNNNEPVINLGDQFVYRLDPSNGTLSANYGSISGNLQNITRHNVVVDGSGNIIAHAGNKVVKFDPSLNQLWSCPLTGSLFESFRITTDNAGNVYGAIYGLFGTVTIGTVAKSNFPNGYLFKLNASDGSVAFADSILISGAASKIKNIIVDNSGNYYLSGDGAFNTTAVLKLDNNKNSIWTTALSSTAKVNDVELLNDDCLYLGGYVTGTATFDSYTISLPAGASGTDNSYMIGYCAGSIGFNDQGMTNGASAFPNPFDNYIRLRNISTGSIIYLYSLQGQQLQKFSLTDKSERIDLSHLPKGNYIMEIVDPAEKVTRLKLIRQ